MPPISSQIVAHVVPKRRIPPPEGPNSVGARKVDFVAADGQGLVAMLLYPTSTVKSKKCSNKVERLDYLPHGEDDMKGVVDFAGLPLWVLAPLGRVHIPAAVDAPLKGDSVPLIIFSHGQGGLYTVYSTLLLNLASYGYAVLTIQHTDGSGAYAERSDGQKIPFARPPDVTSGTGLKDRNYDFRVQQVETRLKECRAAVDYFDSLNSSSDSPFKGKLDLSRLSIMGHSFGGITALEACRVDSRIRAVIAYDPWLYAASQELRKSGLNVPVYILEAEAFGYENNTKIIDEFKANSSAEVTVEILPGAAHQNYTDFPFFATYLSRKVGLIGSADPTEVLRTVITKSISFLEKSLKIMA
mmetsp:Transcript_13426/g.22024  ORF Transcript_13426/g.22024 Transcript_13426/m.22024 type:complete len:356 (-) Transcript_13426:326-1393(-)|eukprot:CAMPEP_0184648086 /NCGR_PEP_ID=MMETSP0308-20130426/5171_1 /TAXON_ID=38269 /ORGANISM="Gloeochaete witrockiana, Strain SAG 46.84" /LENGTH=355 /DNA_ID=CAMNT_0027079659 /DNA_START=141 /DNA_END=1208 /DNA_ORIENTATION=+